MIAIFEPGHEKINILKVQLGNCEAFFFFFFTQFHYFLNQNLMPVLVQLGLCQTCSENTLFVFS